MTHTGLLTSSEEEEACRFPHTHFVDGCRECDIAVLKAQHAKDMAAVRELVEAAEEGLEASQLLQSAHECHNDDCQDAIRTTKIKAALAKVKGDTP